MNLDELLASLSKDAAATLAARPLVAIADFVPPNSEDRAKFERGGTLIVGALLYWLATRQLLAANRSLTLAPEIESLQHRTGSVLALVSLSFGNQINADDVDASILAFCREYCGASSGSLSSDFHGMFVEGTSLGSFAEVVLDWDALERFAQWIDMRRSLFAQGSKDWNRPFDLTEGKPSLVAAFDSSGEWVLLIRSFADLPETPSGLYKTRLKEYWSAVDAAIGHATPLVAAKLVQTYLWNSDTASQASVWRVLRTFPAKVVVDALIANIASLVEKTDWAPTLVDILDDDLRDDELQKVARQIHEAPEPKRLHYITALHAAGREGSRFANRLLNSIGSTP